MTIDEARELCQLQLESLMNNPQVTLDPKYIQAERMAIASLEAWEKVRQEMEDYKYIPVRDLLITLNRHLQEVTE